MMLRKLFALLLLLTGLAALSQPAQAHVFEVESSRTAADAGYTCAAQTGARATQRATPSQRDRIRRNTCSQARRVVILVPTIMLQADRAHE